MNDGRHFEDPLSPLRDEQAGAGAPRPINRDRVVARMMSVAKDAPRARRRERVVMFTTFAAAATFALSFVAVHFARNTPGANAPEVALLSSLEGEGETTWHGTRGVPLTTGQFVAIEATEDVTTIGAAKAVRLVSGRIRCRVPRLDPSDSFSVVTRDVHVEVRGAVFTIETAREGNTSVSVDEGVVLVHAGAEEVTLTASQSWPPTRPAKSEPARATVPPTTARSASVSTTARSASVSTTPLRGTLDKETRLLRSGLAAERRGDLPSATTSFDRLLARFPQSPLAPDARAALARVRSQQRTAP